MIYNDENWEAGVIRTFTEDVEPEKLIWHRDGEDRIIEATEQSDWKIQLDNQVPIGLNRKVLIKKDEWHRLIKGTGELRLKIIKK